MSEPMHLGLDNPVFAGRLRMRRESQGDAGQARERPSARHFDQRIRQRIALRTASQDNNAPEPIWARPLSKAVSAPEAKSSVSQTESAEDTAATADPITLIKPQPSAEPAVSQQQPAKVLKRQFLRRLPGTSNVVSSFRLHKYTKLQRALVGMAAFIFLFGMAVSLQAFLTNRSAMVQVEALSKNTDNKQPSSGGSVPATTKPSSSAFSKYMVAPDLPRYIKVPKLGINARVLQAGVTASGALDSPSNVFDTAWYTGSAKPGQPGAMLIDGHVSSWTAHGVFYGLKKMTVGDTIQIERGDGAMLTYQVVKSQVYSDDKVDMQAAMTPVVAGKPGLNLITCTGQVKKGTSEFSQRMVVFAVLQS